MVISSCPALGNGCRIMKHPESPESLFRCSEPGNVASKLSLGPDTQNACLANLEARWSRIVDTTTGAFHRALSGCIRRLFVEVHAAASMYGYFDSQNAITARGDPSRKQHISGKLWPLEGTAGSAGPVALNTTKAGVRPGASFPATQSVEPWVLSDRSCLRASWSPCLSFAQLKCGAIISSAAAVGAVIVLFFRSSFAQFVIAAPAVFTFAIVASCAVVWGQLELSAHRCAKRIYQLVADLTLQHKLAGEAVRWIQELEVTFKTFSGAYAKLNQGVTGASPPASPCADSHGQQACGSSQPLREVAVIGPPHCGDLPCCQNDGARAMEWEQLQQNGSRLQESCAWHLRMRLYQVLDWQQRVLCSLYEDIVRWEPGRRLAWKSQISRGPWRHAEQSSCGSHQFDGSLRVLKEMTARSWLLHSRLLGGIQIALRHLLFSLDSRLLRVDFAVKRKLGCNVRAVPFPNPRKKLTRHASRVLKQAILGSQEHHSANGGGKSLREEIDQASKAGDVGGDAQLLKSCSPRPSGNSCTSCPTASGQNRAQEPPTSTVAVAENEVPRCPKRFTWAWTVCVTVGRGLLGACAVVEAVVDGIRAGWWVFNRLYRLRAALSAAGQVAAEAANAVRMILEEDWASCPVPLPQPRWGEGVRRKAESPYICTDADAKSLKLTHWAVCPPASASQYSGTLFKIASDNHRSALASMSRNVAASLALLRLPAAANCCHFKYPGNSLPVQGKLDTDCISGTCSVKSGGSAYESLMSQRSVADEGQQAKEGADAQLCGVLHLILQHLRVASEEGQKLESSLRLTGEKAEHLKTCDNARRSDHVPFKPSEMEPVSDETEQLQQPVVGEPVQCLEVYTAVGQECITNRRRFQEEESLREAFADDDPAVRERSQMTLAELEQKLKKKEKERQCIPRVLKELSIIACDKADGSECGKAEDRAVVRVVSASSSEDGGFSSAAQSPGRISTSLGEGADDLLEKAAPLFTSAGGDDVNARGVAQQGFLGSPPVDAENIVLEAASQQEEACTLPYLETLDNDQVAFRIHQQKLKGCSARNVSFSPETIAAQSLISQLRSVLKRQKRTPLEGQDLLPFTAASSAVTSGSNGSGTFGDSIVDDEWSACDVVEGPNCTAEAPTWVAAPTDLGDNGADGLNGKDECSLEYCEGGSTCKSSGPEVEACSCQNETGSLCLH